MKFVIATVITFFSLFANALEQRAVLFSVAGYEDKAAQAAIVQGLTAEMLPRKWEQEVRNQDGKFIMTYSSPNAENALSIIAKKFGSHSTQFVILGIGNEGIKIQEAIVNRVKVSTSTFEVLK